MENKYRFFLNVLNKCGHLGGLLGVHLKIKCKIRTQDPHHP